MIAANDNGVDNSHHSCNDDGDGNGDGDDDYDHDNNNRRWQFEFVEREKSSTRCGEKKHVPIHGFTLLYHNLTTGIAASN